MTEKARKIFDIDGIVEPADVGYGRIHSEWMD